MGYSSVLDVDSSNDFRKVDIDLVLFGNDNIDTTTVEIKADAYNRIDGKKYIFLETVSNDEKGTPGCIYSSKCNYFIFYYIQYDMYLIINRKKLLSFIKNNGGKYQKKKASTWSADDSKVIYRSFGILVPDEDLIHCGAAEVFFSSHRYIDIKRELFGE